MHFFHKPRSNPVKHAWDVGIWPQYPLAGAELFAVNRISRGFGDFGGVGNGDDLGFGQDLSAGFQGVDFGFFVESLDCVPCGLQ